MSFVSFVPFVFVVVSIDRQEPLHALAVEHFARIDHALRSDPSDRVRGSIGGGSFAGEARDRVQC